MVIRFFILLLLMTPALASATPFSAVRKPGQDWTEAAKSFWQTSKLSATDTQAPAKGKSLGRVLEVAQDFSLFDREAVLENFTDQQMDYYFRYVRDIAFLDDGIPDSQFSRRISWLYPDDGCFVRAAMMSFLLKELNLPSPQRIFVFGNLLVETENAPQGFVQWWYHTALVSKVDSQIFVWDPALEPNHPILLKNWLKLQNEDIDKLKVAICDPNAFSPNSACQSGEFTMSTSYFSLQRNYLDAEWRQQLELGKNPLNTLDHSPPWKLSVLPH